jgi:AraC-like DNA-binding protein
MQAGAPIPFVRASAFAPFVGFLNSIGSPVERWLSQARIPPPLLDDCEALVPVMSAYRFLEAVNRHEPIDGFGVVIGERTSSFDFGAYGAALQGASTVYEYLQLGTRLIRGHSSGTAIWLRPEGTVLRVNQHLKGPPGPGRCIADLYTLVITLNMLRRFLGPKWSPGEVRLLAGAEPFLGDRAVFADAPLITGQRHTSFTISRSFLKLPVPASQTRATPAEGPGFPALQSMPGDFKTSAEQLIVSLFDDGFPSIQIAADAGGMSARTLQRRLGEAGVTYTGLVSASRLRLAKEWLTESDMPIVEIAAALGYTAASNFARAFRRQTGMAPASYRRSQALG